MKKQLFKYSEITGKTITNLDYYDDIFFIEVEGNEFFILQREYDDGDEDYINVSDYDIRDYNPYSLRSLGIIDEAEFNERKKVLEEKQNNKKELELKELARLKAKYE